MKKCVTHFALFLTLACFMASSSFAASPESDFVFSQGEITEYTGSDSHVEIPSTIGGVTVTSIGTYAFQKNSTLTSVVVPDTVKSLGFGVFYNCTKLVDVDLGKGVQSLDISQFLFCSSLKNIVIPESVTSLGSGSFQHCKSLESVTILGNITTLPRNIFYGCTSLTDVTLPNSLKTIEEGAFTNCDLTSFSLSSNVTTLGDMVFSGCNSLKEIYIPASVTKIGVNAFASGFDFDVATGTSNYLDPIDGLTIYTPSNSTAAKYASAENISVVTASASSSSGSTLPSSLNTTTPPSTDSSTTAPPSTDSSTTTPPSTDSSTTTPPSTDSSTTTPPSTDSSTTTPPSTDSSTTTPPSTDSSTTTPPSTDSSTTTPPSTDSSSTGEMGDSRRAQNLVARSDGGFDVVYTKRELDSSGSTNNFSTTLISYDKDFNKIQEKKLTTHLSQFQAIYVGEDYYYGFFNQSNPSESDSVEVIRIVKYDKNWNEVDTLGIKGINTIALGGAFSFAEYDGVLYVHLAHTMYESNDGLNHQANLTFSVKLSDLSLVSCQSVVSNPAFGYVSHSFSQDVIVDSSGHLLRLDNGDAYPRGAYLSRTKSAVSAGTFIGQVDGVQLTSWSGGVGDNNTGAATSDLVETKNGYLSGYINSGKGSSHFFGDSYNGYITFTPKSNFTASGTTTKAVTNYTDGSGEGCSAIRFLSTGPEGGILLYDKYTFVNGPGYQSILYYCTYDADGNLGPVTQLNQELLPTTLSGFNEPLVVGDRIYLFCDTGNLKGGSSIYVIEDRTLKQVVFDASYTADEPTPEEDTALDEESNTIPDSYLVGANSWAVPWITGAYEIGIMAGMEDILGSYQKAITREEFCRLVVNCYESTGKTAPTGQNPFTDTTNPDVISAYHLGIVGGKTLTSFAPYDKITRQELAVMVLRTAEHFDDISGLSTNLNYSDAHMVDTWAKEAVYYAQQENFLVGGDGEIKPLDDLSREEAITVALRLAEQLG